MNEYKLESSKGPDVVIDAELLGSVDTSHDKKNGRWHQYDCYRTEKGTLVVHTQGHSQHDGEESRYEVFHADNEADLVKQVGTTHLAKELYQLCGFDHHKRID